MSRPILFSLLVACAAGCSPGGLASDGGTPAASDSGAASDLASSAIGPHGGSVDRLFFAIHGDTRPANCDETATYPTQIIQNIYDRERALNVQFALDLGDHMYVCNNMVAEAETQMGYYMSAAQTLGKITFMTMGNHECINGAICTAVSGDANSTVYFMALAPISPLPYYSFDIATESGKATFVVVADNSWDPAQQQWLEATLAKADVEARYTIVARHHPFDNTQLSNSAIYDLIRAHKYTLFLTGHSHEYRHDTDADPAGRTLRLGTGGAPLASGAQYYGFGTVTQGADDRLTVAIYDQATGNTLDSFSVAPQ